MDGLPNHLALRHSASVSSMRSVPQMAEVSAQRTLAAPIGCVGVGLHSGRKIAMTLKPAPVGHGLAFRRTDLPGAPVIPARFDCVVDTRLCTVLGLPDRPEIRVGTVEHVVAALAGCGVCNAMIEVDGPEVPILDGSAASLVFLIDCAGIAVQEAPAPVIEVMRVVRVEAGPAYAELRPFPLGFDAAVSITFTAAAIGHQALSMRLTAEAFRGELARARTFTLAHEVAQLRDAGLARGGSLDNAVVVDGDRVLNPLGLRMSDEFVRHKMLDAVGDLALAGASLRARFVAHRCGHGLNSKLLHALFSDDANWRHAGSEQATYQGQHAVRAYQPGPEIWAAA